jgi:Golgi phosphoprotein 3
MSVGQAPLYLHEEILLLALRDQEGTIASGSMYAYAIGGAILAELLLAKRIAVEGGKQKLINVVSTRPLGEPLIDECLEKIAAAKRRGTPQTWVQRFAHLKQLKHRVAQGLCNRSILGADEDTVLLLFRRKIYPEIDPRPERQVIGRLRKAIFGEGRQVDPRTAVLISLANGAGLLTIPFDKKELKARKQRIEQLVNGELLGRATREAVQAAQAAVMIGCIMPAVMATTAVH